jgi:chemotaxis protein MotB
MPPPSKHGARRTRSRGGHGDDHEEGGAERWLVTYADMLTLLLVLFIVLFSISVVNTSKFISLKTSLAAVFGDGTKGMLSGGNGLNENDASGTGQQMVMAGSPIDTTQGTTTKTGPAGVPHYKSAILPGGYTQQDVQNEVSDYKSVRKAIEASLRAHGMQGAVKFSITSRGLVITMVTNALVFPGNSAQLLPEGQQILANVVPPLAAEHRMLEVDGYTNQEHTSTAPYPSGWELSSARASAVVRYLVANGVAEQRLSAVGMNDLHPLYPPSDPRSVTQNRRVEIVVLSSLPSTAGAALATAGSS